MRMTQREKIMSAASNYTLALKLNMHIFINFNCESGDLVLVRELSHQITVIWSVPAQTVMKRI